MKKIISLVLVICVIFLLSSCMNSEYSCFEEMMVGIINLDIAKICSSINSYNDNLYNQLNFQIGKLTENSLIMLKKLYSYTTYSIDKEKSTNEYLFVKIEMVDFDRLESRLKSLLVVGNNETIFEYVNSICENGQLHLQYMKSIETKVYIVVDDKKNEKVQNENENKELFDFLNLTQSILYFSKY